MKWKEKKISKKDKCTQHTNRLDIDAVMAGTEIQNEEQVHEDEQFYDSNESVIHEESAKYNSDPGHNNTVTEFPTSQAASAQLINEPSDDVGVKPKQRIGYRSPRIIRRSQRNTKRKRAEHLSRSFQGDYCDELALAEGLSDIEQSFNSRMSKMEQTFEKMMTAHAKQSADRDAQNSSTLQQFLSEFEGKMTDKITQIIDDKVTEKTAQLSQQVQTLTADLAATKKEMQEAAARLEQNARNITEEMSAKIEDTKPADDATTKNIQDRINDVSRKVKEINSTMNKHNQQFETLELHSRKLNLVFEGVQLHGRESCQQVIERIIHRNMRLDNRITVDVAHTLGDRVEGKQVPIIARFKSVADKQRVLENSQEVRRDGIYIRPDYPTAMNERRSYLAKSLAAAKMTDPRARLLRDRLQYKGVLYTVENIHEAGIGDKHHTTYTDTQVRFYGYNSPFSNFHRSQFTLHGVNYNCVEQALQAHRAYRNKDDDTWHRIMMEKIPVNMKRLGKPHRPKTVQEEEIDRRVMEDAVYAKFQQNDRLKRQLLDTQTKAFYECNPYDHFYGTGLKMTDPKMTRREFRGANHMGTILESVRTKLSR